MFPRRRRRGLVRSVGRTAVVAGTATAVVGGVRHRQSQRWAGQDQQSEAEAQAAYQQGQIDAIAQAPPPMAPAPPVAEAPDVLTQLERLGTLRDEGVLTDAEFSAEKAKILAG